MLNIAETKWRKDDDDDDDVALSRRKWRIEEQTRECYDYESYLYLIGFVVVQSKNLCLLREIVQFGAV